MLEELDLAVRRKDVFSVEELVQLSCSFTHDTRTVVLEIGYGQMLQHRNLVQHEPRCHIVVDVLQIVNVPMGHVHSTAIHSVSMHMGEDSGRPQC